MKSVQLDEICSIRGVSVLVHLDLQISGGDPVQDDPSEGDPIQDDPSEGDPSEGDPSEGDPSEGDPSEGDPVGPP